MTKPQFIKGPGGEDFAIIPKAEYERLRRLAADEDIGTARLVGKARAAVERGGDIVLPKSVVDRLAKGENPIRVLRDWRDVTQLHLAFKTGLSQSYLSDLEHGRRTGSAETLATIAHALDVPLDLLVTVD